MTFEKKFTSLKTKFDKADTKKLPENFAIQLTMTDEDCGGTFYIANINGVFSVEPYDYKDNNAAVTGTAAVIAKISAGTVASELEIFGDAQVVADLAGAYKKPAVKSAAAKTTAKKPTAKSVCKAKSAETKAASKPAEKTAAKKTAAKATKPAAKTVKADAEKAVKAETAKPAKKA